MIYVTRHGQTDWNLEKKVMGRCDIPLNENGKEQAKIVRDFLENTPIDKIICSPLLRAKETAWIINEKKQVEIVYDNRFIERDFGEFEGLTRSEFDFNGFWNIYSNQNFNKAESIPEVQNRVFNLLDELRNNPNENILIVAHGGVGLVLMSYFEGVPEDGNYLNFELGTGKLKEFSFEKILKR